MSRLKCQSKSTIRPVCSVLDYKQQCFGNLGHLWLPGYTAFVGMFFACYSPYTILWKPPFCISPCSKTPTYKYDIVILFHSKSHKKCHKNFENRFINKNLMPRNDLDLVFYMCKGGIPKILNLEF